LGAGEKTAGFKKKINNPLNCAEWKTKISEQYPGQASPKALEGKRHLVNRTQIEKSGSGNMLTVRESLRRYLFS